MRIESIVMRRFLSAAFLLAVSSNSYPETAGLQRSFTMAPSPVVTTMESLRDRYRPLLIFASSDNSPQLAEQIRLLAAGAIELRERQVFVVLVLEEVGKHSDAGSSKAHEFVSLKLKEATAVRRRFRADAGEFTALLVGKDGSEKFRTTAPVTIEKLDAVIDAMPMRQQEERNGHAK